MIGVADRALSLIQNRLQSVEVSLILLKQSSINNSRCVCVLVPDVRWRWEGPAMNGCHGIKHLCILSQITER